MSHPATPGEAQPNALIHESSPYLLQHAYNPVAWMPWGEVAFTRAREEKKPVFLSIGYAACHWCHVMAHESFENERIAAFLNEHFISIKVDREERPDVDAIYMQAVQLISGSGGWPLTAFLDAKRRPFFGGTYFPPETRYGRIGFLDLLGRILEVWREQGDKIEDTGAGLAQAIAAAADVPAAPGTLSLALLENATRDLAQRFDGRDGGFGGAPKFPPSMALQLLLGEWQRTRDPHLREMAEVTLKAMAHGGLYDQLGGGFHRYSTDAQWLVPHFEKMLYDNALLAMVYIEAARAFATAGADNGAPMPHPEWLRIGGETLDYVLREMAGQDEGFYSSQDADSEGVEGKYYIWRPGEIEAPLVSAGFRPDEIARIAAYYDIAQRGNWAEGEGASILHIIQPMEEFAAQEAVNPAQFEARLKEARGVLLAARAIRMAPGTDDKVIVAWNGMMIAALARGAQVTGDSRYADAASRAAAFILSQLRGAGGELLHSWRAGQGRIGAFLDDYAQLILALVELYETTFDGAWLREADALAAEMLRRFEDPLGGGFYSDDGRDATLIARLKEYYDGATPSGNSSAVKALLRLGHLLGREAYLTAARRTLRNMAGAMQLMPGAYHELLGAAALEVLGPTEIAVVLGEGLNLPDEASSLLDVVYKSWTPQRILALGESGPPMSENPPIAILENRKAGPASAVYVCRCSQCSAPMGSPIEVARELAF